MAVKWKSSSFPGVRYYEHATRKHGVKRDRYFAIRFQSNGKRREEGLGWASEGWTESKAVVELTKLKEAARKGEGPTSLAEKRSLADAKREAQKAEEERVEREGITFGQFWRETYFPQCQQDKTRGTWKREASFYNKWLGPCLSELPMLQISPMALERMKSKMVKEGLAARSIAYCLDVVRQVFNRAIHLGLYEGKSPTATVKKPKADNRRIRFLSQEEAITLLDALNKRSQALHDMALLSLQCGLRAGELFNLKWADVDLDRGKLILRDTKSGKTRAAFLTSAAKEVLALRSSAGRDGLVFPSRTGGRRVQVSKAFGRTVKDLGWNDGITDPRDKVVFHTLRHTFASWLVMKGTPLYTVGKLLGHSSSAMTERYSHLAPEYMKEAVITLEKALKRGKEMARSDQA